MIQSSVVLIYDLNFSLKASRSLNRYNDYTAINGNEYALKQILEEERNKKEEDKKIKEIREDEKIEKEKHEKDEKEKEEREMKEKVLQKIGKKMRPLNENEKEKKKEKERNEKVKEKEYEKKREEVRIYKQIDVSDSQVRFF